MTNDGGGVGRMATRLQARHQPEAERRFDKLSVPLSPLQKWLGDGFELVLPMTRQGTVVTIRTGDVALSREAWANLGQPQRVHVLIGEDRLLFIAADNADKTAFRHNANDVISSRHLLRRLNEGGWERRRYPARMEEGALVVRREADDGA